MVKLQNRATEALRGAYEELVAELPRQPVLGIDESPTKEANRKAWLWTFVAEEFTLFRVTETRQADILDELLTADFDGIVTCDRAKMYFRLPRLQWCWAHLKRDFQALAECGVSVARNLGRKLLDETQHVFRQWTRCRDGTITLAGLKSSLGQTRRQVDALLRRGLRCRHAKTSGLCQQLLHHRERLWTTVDVPQSRRRRTNQQRQRAGLASRGDLAKAVLRHPECCGQPLRGDLAERDRNLPAARARRLHLRHPRNPTPPQPQTTPLTPPQGVNGYRSALSPTLIACGLARPSRPPTLSSGAHRKAPLRAFRKKTSRIE